MIIMQKLITVMEGSKTLNWSSKFPWAHKCISSNFIDNLGKRPRKGSPALDYAIQAASIPLIAYITFLSPWCNSPPVGQGLLIIKLSRSHSDTQHLVELL